MDTSTYSIIEILVCMRFHFLSSNCVVQSDCCYTLYVNAELHLVVTSWITWCGGEFSILLPMSVVAANSLSVVKEK